MKNPLRLFALIGIFIFIYLLSTINLSILADSFRAINPFYLILSLLAIIPAVLIKSFKWLILLDKEDRIPLGKAVFAWVAGFGAGIITPAKAGDFFRAKFIKARFGKSVLSVLVDRLSDVFSLFILGIFSVFILFSNDSKFLNLNYLFLLFFILFIIGILFLKNEKLVLKFGRPFYRVFIPEKFKKTIGENFSIFYRNFEKLEKKKIGANLILTFLSWFIVFLQYWFLSVSFGMNLSYFIIALISPILILVQLIPISISGIGTREAASILLLSGFGIAPEQAIAFSIGILLEDFIIGGIGLLLLIKSK